MRPIKPASQQFEQDAPTLSECQGIRCLHFNSPWVQGAMRIKDPDELVLEYAILMMAWLLFRKPMPSDTIGLLGLGAGSFARFCAKHTRSHVVAVERNAQVVAVCHTFFPLPGPRRFSIDHEDAATWVADSRNAGRCPILMVDLYDADARGPVESSVDFYRHCRRVLGENGILAVNLFGAHESFAHNINNLSVAFDDRLALLPMISTGNRVVLAFTGPPIDMSAAAFSERVKEVETTYGLPLSRWACVLIAEAPGGRIIY